MTPVRQRNYGAIAGATQANPVVVTSVGHGLSDGDKVFIEGVAGMTELNNAAFYVNSLTADTFSLYSDPGLTLAKIKEIYRAGHGIKAVWEEMDCITAA